MRPRGLASAPLLFALLARRSHWTQRREAPYRFLKKPTITIKVGKEERTLKAQALIAATNIGSVIQSFQQKYKPEMIAKYYPGPLDAAIKLKL